MCSVLFILQIDLDIGENSPLKGLNTKKEHMDAGFWLWGEIVDRRQMECNSGGKKAYRNKDKIVSRGG